jgi:hypothetical protein
MVKQRTLSFLLIQTGNKTIPALVRDNRRGSKEEAALPYKSQRGIQHETISSSAFRHAKFILHFLQDTHTHTHTHTHTYIQRQQNFSVEKTFLRVLIESLCGLYCLKAPKVRTSKVRSTVPERLSDVQVNSTIAFGIWVLFMNYN